MSSPASSSGASDASPPSGGPSREGGWAPAAHQQGYEDARQPITHSSSSIVKSSVESSDLASLHALSKAASQSRQEPPKGRTLSCSECKRRKIRCDRKYPCGPCILRNDQARCKMVIRWEAGCSLSEFTILQNRVNELENRMEGMQKLLGSSAGAAAVPAFDANGASTSSNGVVRRALNAPTPKQELTADPPTPSGPNGSVGPAPRNGGNNGREDDAVMMLEDFAMGNRANSRRAAQVLVPRPGIPSSVSFSGSAVGGSNDSPSWQRIETAVNQRSADPAIDVAYRFLRLAPSPEIQREIVHYWFDRLEWYTKCLYKPHYMDDLNLLLSLDPETAARTVRPTFLCVHFIVICLVIHLCSGEEVTRWGYDRQSAMTLCDAFFAGSQQLLWASDFIGSHQLEHLQAVVLMSVYAYNVDEQADAAYALVGASIKIAQNLALNRLDDVRYMEKERQKGKSAAGSLLTGNAQPTFQTTSPVEREIGKRVWWYLIWLDWSHALSHGGCYSIHPAHNRTSMPSNVSDEDLEACSVNTANGTGVSLLIAKPLDEYTSMSFTIWRLRFLNLYRETIDILNTPTGMTQTLLLEMDKKLMDMLGGLPSYFQLKIDQHDQWTMGASCRDMELLSIQITGWNRLLRLHRPFLARALYDRSNNNHSRKRCVEAAFNILALFRHARYHAPLLLKVWINIYYLFSGALVLFLDLCYDDGNESKEEKRKAIREILTICDQARHLSAAAKNTFALLQGLLEAETELRVHQRQNGDNEAAKDANGTGKNKRKRAKPDAGQPSFSPFVSLVDRVLVDAASKHGSGESSSSMGRSPSEYGLANGLIEPPSKRHTTSYVRDRQVSTSSSNGGPFDDMRYGSNGRPSAPSFSHPGAAGMAGAGHGNYSADHKAVHASPSSAYGNPNAVGTYSPTAASSNQQGSPWNRPTPGGGAASWVSSSLGPNGFPSPSTTSFVGGGGPAHPAPMGSPSTMYSGGGHPPFGAHPQAGPGAGGPAARGAAATTSGLSSLLDEDIFSGLLMNQHMETDDWASALALVAPLPTPQATGNDQNPMARPTSSSSGGASGNHLQQPSQRFG